MLRILNESYSVSYCVILGLYGIKYSRISWGDDVTSQKKAEYKP